MKRTTALVFSALLTLSLLMSPAAAQRHRDPLTEAESDQLRETAVEPVKRMKLLVKFARARMEAVDHMRSVPKMTDEEAEKVRSLLDDVANLVDEIDDNLSMYNGRGDDLRKALKEVIEVNSDFQLKLRTLKETSSPEALKQYGFSLEDAMESVNASADSSRAMLESQNASRGKDKSKDAKDKDKDEDTETRKNSGSNSDKAEQRQQKKEQDRRCPPPC
ncbi:MAG TPA: hypothetical protein VN622_10470 [Clostridia bacterium]|nr:hypothetical protein [Clostridia bacterium]